jgi:hypothetical protein
LGRHPRSRRRQPLANPAYTRTREEDRAGLPAEAWQLGDRCGPLKRLALRLGVSDVALGKACRKAGIPLPGVGYWQKKPRQTASVRRTAGMAAGVWMERDGLRVAYDTSPRGLAEEAALDEP